jgi:hypothetical protein
MNDFYQKYYLHQIGDMNTVSTYTALNSILKNKAIFSRKKLDELGIEYGGLWQNSTGPTSDKFEYIDSSTHYEIISLFDPLHKWINKTILNNQSNFLFNPNGIGLVISRDVNLSTNKKGTEIGEVQVIDIISKDFICGIVLPNETMVAEVLYQKLISKITEMCINQDWELPIYDYLGNQLYLPQSKKI